MVKLTNQQPIERDAYQHTTDDYARPSTEIKLKPLTPEERAEAEAVAKANLAHVAKAIGEGNRELLPENLTRTGSETLLTKGPFRPLTPEEQAASQKRMDETVASMIETMTQQNREDGFLKE